MSFDVLAPHYRWMEWVLAGEKLQRCRTAFLQNISPPREVLMLGEGTGRCLIELLNLYPQARVTCVDASAGMIDQMRQRVEPRSAARVEWVHADILQWQPRDVSFDLTVSHFFLDCFRSEQIAAIVGRVAQAATPQASWLMADFRQPPSGLQSLRARLILWSMYRFFRTVTNLPARQLSDPAAHMNQHGFELRAQRLSEWGLLRSDWWQRPVIPG